VRGMSGAKFKVLRALGTKAWDIKKLCAKLGMLPGPFARCWRALYADGLVELTDERGPDPHTLRRTPAGTEVLG
jgi:DNA-binding IclR family transcriptional regulator